MITLNAPADFSDPRTGRTYRLFQEGFDGPWTPEDPKFDKLAGDDRNRDHIYLSQLTVNYDPGRSLKYAGCLLVIMGIAVVYFVRRGQGPGVRGRTDCQSVLQQGSEVRDQGQRPLAVSHLPSLLVALAALLAGCAAAGAAPLDWDAWEHMPALGRGGSARWIRLRGRRSKPSAGARVRRLRHPRTPPTRGSSPTAGRAASALGDVVQLARRAGGLGAGRLSAGRRRHLAAELRPAVVRCAPAGGCRALAGRPGWRRGAGRRFAQAVSPLDGGQGPIPAVESWRFLEG